MNCIAAMEMHVALTQCLYFGEFIPHEFELAYWCRLEVCSFEITTGCYNNKY